MSPRTVEARAAALFAALGDPTRLQVIGTLSTSGPLSITDIALRFEVTRQAVTKHLEVLSLTGLVSDEWRGRERVWRLEARRLDDARRELDRISRRWDAALERLRSKLEE